MKRFFLFLSIVLLLLLVFGCNAKVNKSIYIEDGDKVRGNQMSVNGSVTIGSDCEVKGSCKSVNGSVTVGDNSKVRGLQSVNGSVRVGENSKVHGSIQSVNGGIVCESGVMIRGDISSVNGNLELTNTRVRDDLSTYNGNIRLSAHSVIGGDIKVKEGKGNNDRKRKVRIDVGDGSVVEGDVRVRGKNIQVTVYLSGGGEVKGDIVNAKVVKEDL